MIKGEDSPSFWPSLPNSQYGGARQSPINIDTNQMTFDPSLRNLTFSDITNPHSIKFLTNNGHTEEGLMEVRGGGLSHAYTAGMMHFHWGGDSLCHPGSEHTVDSSSTLSPHLSLSHSLMEAPPTSHVSPTFSATGVVDTSPASLTSPVPVAMVPAPPSIPLREFVQMVSGGDRSPWVGVGPASPSPPGAPEVALRPLVMALVTWPSPAMRVASVLQLWCCDLIGGGRGKGGQ
ncbi:unnamed protein product, partial [Coregonus sp. 'balchen']